MGGVWSTQTEAFRMDGRNRSLRYERPHIPLKSLLHGVWVMTCEVDGYCIEGFLW